jgi:glycosyltransferase involved in cell wall biosynthesis
MHTAINAHLLSPVAGYRQAGVSVYIEQLLRHLWPAAQTRASHDRWTIYAPPGVTRARIQAPPNAALRISRLPTSQPLPRIVWEQLVAPAALLRTRPDVLFCPLNVVPLLAPCPTVVTVHDLAFLRFNLHQPAKRRYLAALTRLSVKRAAHVITVSEFTRSEVLDLLGVSPTRVTAILNGRDERFAPVDAATIERFRAAKDLPPRFVLFVGTLEPRKNVTTLIRAYARVQDELAMPLLIAGGKGWLYDDVFALVRELGLEQRVQFTGFIDHEDLPLYYAAATTFVYPSLYEGFGIPPLEALATGTPVIVSTAGALLEVVGDAGLAVPPQDVAALADALVRSAVDQQLRAELRARGLERARQFSWQRAAEQTLAVLRAAAEDET